MINIFNKLLTKAATKDFLWIFLKPISIIGSALTKSRTIYLYRKNLIESKSKFDAIFKNSTVLNGPFKGLIYPEFNSVGSALYPKLLGTYECELHHSILNELDSDYSEIIDIGCAEGYYAIGMAKRYSNAKVFAFDINSNAQKLCSEMAALNSVSQNIEINSECTPSLLESFSFTKKGLIICDCEGYEKSLFNSSNLENLKQCDLIIELHDFIDNQISITLKNLFSKTHNIQSVYSLETMHKVRRHNYSEISELNLIERNTIISEGRPEQMEWIICKSK